MLIFDFSNWFLSIHCRQLMQLIHDKLPSIFLHSEFPYFVAKSTPDDTFWVNQSSAASCRAEISTECTQTFLYSSPHRKKTVKKLSDWEPNSPNSDQTVNWGSGLMWTRFCCCIDLFWPKMLHVFGCSTRLIVTSCRFVPCFKMDEPKSRTQCKHSAFWLL